jgi:hypothetical protein
MKKEIKELAQVVASMGLVELEQGYRRRLLILDSQIEAFRAMEQKYKKVLAEMEGAVTQLQALHQINMRLLNIVNSPTKVGEEGWDDKGSSQYSIHKRFAGNTH